MLLLLMALQMAGAEPGPPPLNDTVTLSPADREAALREGEARASRELPINGAPSAIHGEVGVAIGSHGGRAAWGAAEVPLGVTGRANFSVSQERFGSLPR
jgi:hypothetical protein